MCVPVKLLGTVLGIASMAFISSMPSTARAEDSSSQVAALRHASLAARLAFEAQARRDPILMLAAVRLLDDSHLPPSRALVQQPGPAESADELSMRRDAWLATAAPWSVGRAEVQALLADAQASRPRGTTIGSEVGRAVVSAQGVRTIRLSYAAQDKARFGITADPNAQLQLQVLGEDDEAVCQVQTDGRSTECEWQPVQLAEWRIRIANLSAVAVQFVFFHN